MQNVKIIAKLYQPYQEVRVESVPDETVETLERITEGFTRNCWVTLVYGGQVYKDAVAVEPDEGRDAEFARTQAERLQLSFC